jgi:hypothetical protein
MEVSSFLRCFSGMSRHFPPSRSLGCGIEGGCCLCAAAGPRQAGCKRFDRAAVGLTLTDMTAEEIRALLKLAPHPVEGGWFRRTFTSPRTVNVERGVRAQSSAIYYLLEAGAFSELHRLESDEMFHFYLGDPVEMLQLYPEGGSALFTLGPDLAAGHRVQLLVPAGVWQGMRLIGAGKVALLGCTVTPGFNYADYRNAKCAELTAQWPAQAGLIRALTRS